jgi:hypothetical protein
MPSPLLLSPILCSVSPSNGSDCGSFGGGLMAPSFRANFKSHGYYLPL